MKPRCSQAGPQSTNKSLDRFKKYGSKYPFEVIWINHELAYFGQIYLLAIWSTQRWPRIRIHRELLVKLAALKCCHEVSSLASTSEWSGLKLGLVPGQSPDWIWFFPNINGGEWFRNTNIKHHSDGGRAVGSAWSNKEHQPHLAAVGFTNQNMLEPQSVGLSGVGSTRTRPDRETPQAIWQKVCSSSGGTVVMLQGVGRGRRASARILSPGAPSRSHTSPRAHTHTPAQTHRDVNQTNCRRACVTRGEENWK